MSKPAKITKPKKESTQTSNPRELTPLEKITVHCLQHLPQDLSVRFSLLSALLQTAYDEGWLGSARPQIVGFIRTLLSDFQSQSPDLTQEEVHRTVAAHALSHLPQSMPELIDLVKALAVWARGEHFHRDLLAELLKLRFYLESFQKGVKSTVEAMQAHAWVAPLKR